MLGLEVDVSRLKLAVSLVVQHGLLTFVAATNAKPTHIFIWLASFRETKKCFTLRLLRATATVNAQGCVIINAQSR